MIEGFSTSQVHHDRWFQGLCTLYLDISNAYLFAVNPYIYKNKTGIRNRSNIPYSLRTTPRYSNYVLPPPPPFFPLLRPNFDPRMTGHYQFRAHRTNFSSPTQPNQTPINRARTILILIPDCSSLRSHLYQTGVSTGDNR